VINIFVEHFDETSIHEITLWLHACRCPLPLFLHSSGTAHHSLRPGRSEATLQNTFTANICLTDIMAVTARPKIAKSENGRSALVCLPLRGDPGERLVDPNSLERVYTGPGLESRCRPSLSARFGNRRQRSINSRGLS